MKYIVLERLSYNGQIYNKNEEIEVLDMYVESLLKRGLIEEIKETPQLTKEELLKLTKDKLIELATSKGITIDEELTKKEIIALILGD